VAPRRSNKLDDCRCHGAGAELFIVEGISAASSVAALRNLQHQAVLPMQGKPLNAWRAGLEKVKGNTLYSRLSEVLHIPIEASPQTPTRLQSAPLRFERVLLLFDPDADGIHIGALMLMFFAKWMRPLLDQGSICMIRPPLYRLRWNGQKLSAAPGEEMFAYSDAQCQAMSEKLRDLGAQRIDVQHFRGLATMDPALLRERCLDPSSRTTQTMAMVDALAAVKTFSPSLKPQKSQGPSP
jgi:DNA gyrase subunit B